MWLLGAKKAFEVTVESGCTVQTSNRGIKTAEPKVWMKLSHHKHLNVFHDYCFFKWQTYLQETLWEHLAASDLPDVWVCHVHQRLYLPVGSAGNGKGRPKMQSLATETDSGVPEDGVPKYVSKLNIDIFNLIFFILYSVFVRNKSKYLPVLIQLDQTLVFSWT